MENNHQEKETNAGTENTSPSPEMTPQAAIVKKKANPSLILGIIGTSTGALALLIILIGGLLHLGGGREMMDRYDNEDRGQIRSMMNQSGNQGSNSIRGQRIERGQGTIENCCVTNQ